MPKKYTAEERERAVRMVREQVPEFGSVTAAAGRGDPVGDVSGDDP